MRAACARARASLERTADDEQQVYFCDPQNPWQRATNENTNGLLRQYSPKGTDLSGHSADEIAAVAAILNTRPRKTLKWKTPAEALDEAAIEGIIIVTRASTSRSRFFARIGDRAGGSRVAPSSAALSKLARAPHATRAREES